jgi:hypothetical protein
MKPSDFFTEEEFPDLGGPRLVFDSPLDELRRGPKEGISDLDAAYSLAQLAYNQLAIARRQPIGC